MRYVLLFLVFAFTLVVGCTKTQKCDLGESAASLVAAQIATTLECKNLSAVKTDVEKKLVDLKICEKKEQAAKSAIGDLICKPVIDGMVSGLVGQIPKTWECTGGQISEDLKTKLVEACNKAL